MEFGVKKDVFIAGRGKRDIHEARRYAFCVLHNQFGLPIRYIAKKVFKLKWHTSVSMVLQYQKSLNLNVKPDREFSEKLTDIQEKINANIKRGAI